MGWPTSSKMNRWIFQMISTSCRTMGSWAGCCMGKFAVQHLWITRCLGMVRVLTTICNKLVFVFAANLEKIPCEHWGVEPTRRSWLTTLSGVGSPIGGFVSMQGSWSGLSDLASPRFWGHVQTLNLNSTIVENHHLNFEYSLFFSRASQLFSNLKPAS